MPNLFDRFLIVLIAIPMGMQGVDAQNLVPNPSFEVQIDCPYLYHDTVAVPWQHANAGTTDHFHECADPNYCGIPANGFGYQFALTGDAYGGGNCQGFPDPNYREYLMAPLLSPLVANKMYYLSFYLSLADSRCAIQWYGVHLSQDPPPTTPGYEYLIELNPQFENTTGYLSDTTTWIHLDGCILAKGGERWITLGNFKHYSNSILDPGCTNWPPRSYYYVDDVSLNPTDPDEEFEADIGGPFVECFEVTVDPEVPGVYYWSDGTIGPTFTTNESGIYSFSVVDSCRLGTGTFEVVVLGEPVDLGSDEVQVCIGDVFTITLDEEYGEYMWSTGSTSHTIDITEPGEYSVTVDDGCIVSTAEIEVEFVDPVPDPILGDDTHICNGEALEINLDAIIGEFIWQDGTTENFYSIENAGTYTVTVSNACGQESDEITVIEIVEPEVELGPDTILCENSTIEIQLDPAQGDYVWQDGNDDPHYLITSPGTYTVYVSNACGSQSDDLNVVLIPQLVPALNNTIPLCPAQLPFTLDATTPGAVSYIWNDLSTLPQQLVTQSGTYAITISNTCFTVADTAEVVVSNMPPVVMLPPDTLLCTGNAIVLTNSGATGNYLWQDNSTNDSLTVIAPGMYSLAVSNICGTGNDTIQVDYLLPLTVPDLGPDFSLCTGETFTLVTSNTNVSYLWQDLSTADTFVVSGPGIYHITIADQCSAASDTVVVTINNNPPDVDLPTSLNLCQGEAITLEAGIGGVSYVWQDGSQASSLVITTPGTYSLTVSSNCGVDEDSVVVIDLGPLPGVELGNNVDLCEGETLTLTPVFFNVDNWLWNDGSTLPSLDITTGGEVSIQATNACGNIYDTLVVSLLPAIPSLSLGNDTAICPGTAVILAINIADVDIAWSDGTQGNSIEVTDAGTYHAMITNACGQAADTVEIAVLPEAPAVDLGADHQWCTGDVIVFDPGVSDAAYVWQDGSTGNTFTATTPGTIILNVSNSCGIDIDTVLITLNPNGPQVDLGPDVVACEGDIITIEAGIGGVDYEWQDGSTSSLYTTSTSGTLILMISNNCGVDTDTVEVDLSGVGPMVQLGVDTTICEGATLILTSAAQPGTAVEWQDGSTSTDYTVTAAGTYSLMATNACGVDSDTIEVGLAFAPAPFSLGPDTTLCLGESIVLTAPSTGDDILWFDGSTSPTFIADAEQVYTVQVSNQCGDETDALAVYINDDIPEVQLDEEIQRCPEELLSLDVTQPFAVTYEWSTGDTLPSITIITPGTYAITVFNECFTVQDQVVVTEDDCDAHIFIPNVFSPNGDGINDDFAISFSENINVLEIKVSIYDRWGDQVFSLDDYPFSWNGYFKDQPLNPSVFVYRVRVTYMLRSMVREELLVGDVTVLR